MSDADVFQDRMRLAEVPAVSELVFQGMGEDQKKVWGDEEMMTCKDCKIYDECKSPMKDMDDADAMETWAMWCDAFESIHEDKVVETDKYVIVQSGLN